MELNDMVRITLTKKGAEILNNSANELNRAFPAVKFKANFRSGDIYEAILWKVFEEFGGYCSAGANIVFTNLEKVTREW